jgi:hypothetical protein
MRRCETDLLNWFSLSIGPVDNRDLDDQSCPQYRCFSLNQVPSGIRRICSGGNGPSASTRRRRPNPDRDDWVWSAQSVLCAAC